MKFFSQILQNGRLKERMKRKKIPAGGRLQGFAFLMSGQRFSYAPWPSSTVKTMLEASGDTAPSAVRARTSSLKVPGCMAT